MVSINIITGRKSVCLQHKRRNALGNIRFKFVNYVTNSHVEQLEDNLSCHVGLGVRNPVSDCLVLEPVSPLWRCRDICDMQVDYLSLIHI